MRKALRGSDLEHGELISPRARIDAKHTADVVVLVVEQCRLKVLLVVRDNPPFRGKLALPGGFLRPGEELEETARRELFEETGVDVSLSDLIQIKTYSGRSRDPRFRAITTSYAVIVPTAFEVFGGTDARSADWVEVESSLKFQLAFDHWSIIRDTLHVINQGIELTPLATSFCEEEFTISELRTVFEVFWGFKLDPGNFRKKVVTVMEGFVEPTRRQRANVGGGRPATLYRRGDATVLNPPMLKPRNKSSPRRWPVF